MALHRLHISGLSPSISRDDLVARLSLFGTVDAVYPSSRECENGAPRTSAIVHLEADDAQYRKLTNTLNGTMWKGSKLKLQQAKKSYFDRMKEEREAAEQQPPRKKRRKNRLAKGVDGVQGRKWELVTPENVHRHAGWISDSLVFPLLTRPDHPVQLPVAKTTAWTRSRHKERRAESKREMTKDAPARGRKIRIVMSRYGSRKTVFPLDDATLTDESSSHRGSWSFDDETGEWTYTIRGKTVLREAVPKLKSSKRYTDKFSTMLDALVTPVCAANPDVAQYKERALADGEERSRKSASPPPFVPTARQVLFNDEDSHMLAYSSLSAAEQQRQLSSERDRMRALALSLAGVQSEPIRPDSKSVMRLKGGAAFGDNDSDSDSDSSDSSAESDSSALSDNEGKDEESKKKKKEQEPTATNKQVKMDTLKDMFKPQEASTFSLMGDIDADMLDDDSVIEDEAEAIPTTSISTTTQAVPFRPPAPIAKGAGRAWPAVPASARFFELSDEQRRMADSFFRQDSLDEIERKHAEMQDKLRGFARKRHREAKRKAQR